MLLADQANIHNGVNIFTMIHKVSIFLKTRFPKLAWKYAPFIWRGNTDASVEGMQRLLSSEEKISERMLLEGVEKIRTKKKVRSICELGSGAGRNIFYLMNHFPHADYLGLDINRSLVQGGNEYFKAYYQDHAIKLKEADIETIRLENNKKDIIFTSMTLIYIAPDKILNVIGKIVKNSKSGVIFQEIQGINNSKDTFAGYLHNYDNLLEELCVGVDFNIEKSVIKYDGWTSGWHQAYQYTLVRK